MVLGDHHLQMTKVVQSLSKAAGMLCFALYLYVCIAVVLGSYLGVFAV